MEPVILQAVDEFPAVVLSGPRQSGKTTLLKHLFRDQFEYVSLETPDTRRAAQNDPRGFLALYPSPVIFDEIQFAPDLLFYIKEMIDSKRELNGQFILTGSQNLLLMQGVTESLAGRAAVLHLMPLTSRESAMAPLRTFPWEGEADFKPQQDLTGLNLWRQFLRGYYPELISHPKKSVNLWHGSFIQTYLERDLRLLRQVGDLTLFQDFLQALAPRSAQLLNMTELSRDLGVAVNTVKSWISILEATHQIFLLRPYFVNVGKRLVKTPKVYFTDVGTLSYLSSLTDPLHAANSPVKGALMETAVISEIMKTFRNRGFEPRLHFWRTTAGSEVDLIVECSGKVVPIEIKSSATPRPAMANSIRVFAKDFGDQSLPGYVIHSGDVVLPLGDGILALPFSCL